MAKNTRLDLAEGERLLAEYREAEAVAIAFRDSVNTFYMPSTVEWHNLSRRWSESQEVWESWLNANGEALVSAIEANYSTATVTYATIDSEVARRLGIEKGKTYTIALLGEVGVRSDG